MRTVMCIKCGFAGKVTEEKYLTCPQCSWKFLNTDRLLSEKEVRINGFRRNAQWN